MIMTGSTATLAISVTRNRHSGCRGGGMPHHPRDNPTGTKKASRM